jgi:hypothetical protein
MDWTEISHLSSEEKKARFRQTTITHRLLEQTHRKIVQAVREPAGFASALVYGPTGVGKSKMIETVVGQLNEELRILSTPVLLRSLKPSPTPVLVIEADPPDGAVFNRGYYYRTVLTLMGEPTYQPSDGSGGLHRHDEILPPLSPITEDAVPVASPVKKTRSRKKVELPAPGQEQGSVIQAESGAEPAPAPPKRRQKKAEAKVLEDNVERVKAPSVGSGEARGLIDAEEAVSPTKPKRTRRVGEPKPKRDAVGEPETHHST